VGSVNFEDGLLGALNERLSLGMGGDGAGYRYRWGDAFGEY
jgi:hypothetical protein